MAKRKSDPYADHARPAEYVATVEIWTKRRLALKAIDFALTMALVFVRGVTAVRITTTPRRRT